MFKVTGSVEPELIERTVVDEMGSSEKLSLRKSEGHIDTVENADQITTKRALDKCAVVQEIMPDTPTTGTIQRASTDSVDMIARYDDLSQMPEQRPKTSNWRHLLQPSQNGTDTYGIEWRPLLRPEQVHPPVQDSTCSQPNVADLRAASNSASVSAPQYQQFLQPLVSPFSAAASPKPVIEQQPYKSHAVSFTIENEIRSALTPTEIELLFQIFSRNSRLLLRSKESPSEGVLYPVEALMKQTSTDFYKWYTVESKAAAKVSVLRFKLLDCQWYDGGAVLIPGWNLRYFQLLKQTIWDSFLAKVFFKLHSSPVSHICQPPAR